MEYFDIIREICNDLNLDCWVYPDGDYPGKEVLQVSSCSEGRKLNTEIKKRFEELNIDPSDDLSPDEDTNYIEFATDGKWEYSDETFVCDGCGQLFRIDYYGYQNFYMGDGFILCPDCMKEEPETYLETLINNYRNANTLLTETELEELGFEKIGEEYENGWYGRSDNPKEILDRILAEEPYTEVIFDITKTYNPFATRFTTYIRKREE